jgi:hypothetical protein
MHIDLVVPAPCLGTTFLVLNHGSQNKTAAALVALLPNFFPSSAGAPGVLPDGPSGKCHRSEAIKAVHIGQTNLLLSTFIPT